MNSLSRASRPSLWLLAIWTHFAATAFGGVTVSPLFADHAVLQRDKPIVVWGQAGPGERVAVTFKGEAQSTVAAADGNWRVALRPASADAAGSDLRVAGTTTQLVFHDVLIGEVWLCSGQSNMTFRLRQADTAAAEIATADFPSIRQFTVAAVTADRPGSETKGNWVVCSPAAAGKFSAVAYFFARGIHQRTQLPIGLVLSAWGGTPIEAWMSDAALRRCPDYSAVQDRFRADLAALSANQAAFDALMRRWNQAEAAAKGRGAEAEGAYLAAHPKPVVPANLRTTSHPSVLFNAMICPLLPLALRGIVWYQGESNAERPAEYAALFPALIGDWRAGFDQGALPFYWVNLPNFLGDSGGDSWARLRAAQTRTLSLPETGQAVAIDLGDPRNIHPTHKQEVGRRLALLAAARQYGSVEESVGPTAAGISVEASAIRVKFVHLGGGLTARGGEVRALEIAGRDGHFYLASARSPMDCDSLLVSSPPVPEPVAVRYAWSNNPPANLYGGTGLPAVPFQLSVRGGLRWR